MDEGVAAFYAGRVDALSYVHPALALQQAKVRKESDPRFRNFLNEEFAKIYQSGQSKQFYEDALKLRGVDISKVPSVIKEEWK